MTTSRRPQGSGSLTERPPGSGHWVLRITVGKDPVTGMQRRQTSRFEARGKKAAEREADRIRTEAVGSVAMGSSAPFRVLLEEWMAFGKARGRSATTIHENQRAIDRVIVPALGDVPIKDLSPRDLDLFYSNLMSRDRPLSPASVRRMHAVLSAALRQGVKWGWLENNPAERASPPPLERKSIEAPTPEQVHLLGRAMMEKGHVYGVATAIAVATGARRGELCAIRWSDISSGRVLIHASAYKVGSDSGLKSTKTGRERVVSLGARVTELLEGWREECRLSALAFGEPLADEAFVLSTWPDGLRPMNPNTLTATFRRCAVAIGLPQIHFHSLRHFAATELLAAGVSPQDAAQTLGHANPTMTLDVYSHATEERQLAAGALLDGYLEGMLGED